MKPIKELEVLRNELERERMRLAACGVAALGYFDGCIDEYKSASLDDVIRLYDKLTRYRAVMEQAVKELESVLCDPEGNACISGSTGDLAEIDKALTALRECLEEE